MQAWWGELHVPEQQSVQFQIGPMSFWVRRQDGDLLLATAQAAASMSELWSPPAVSEAVQPDGTTLHRFAGAQGTLRLAPRLADRPIIARPEHPFWLPSGADVTVYMSAPVWVEVSLGGVPLMELPLYRPSDTWFGPSPSDGELCYAVQTSLRRQLDSQFPRPHRAVTAIQIRNRGADSLRVQRIRLPAPLLGVYAGAGTLRTRGVVLERAGEADTTVRLEPLPADVSLLSSPRQASESGLLRAITSFLP